MNLRKDLFGRFNDMIGEGVGRVQDAADDVQRKFRGNGRPVMRKVRQGYEDGREYLTSAEEALVRSARENMGILAIVALVVLGIILGRLVLSNRRPFDSSDEW